MRTSFAFVIGVAFSVTGCGGKDTPQKDSGVDTGSSIGIDGATVDSAASDGNNAACTTCAMTSCSTQLNACQLDTACQCTYTCKINGGAEGMCKSTCNSNNNTPWTDLIDCLDTMCAGSC